jgi:peptidoglycan hydrolase-like protein with peptidoglycan-binding domain
VTTLQQDLRQVWIDRRSPTGVYDDRTAQDVTTFQSWYNVQGDPPGVYGPNSQAKMAQVLAGKGGSGGNGGGG